MNIKRIASAAAAAVTTVGMMPYAVFAADFTDFQSAAFTIGDPEDAGYLVIGDEPTTISLTSAKTSGYGGERVDEDFNSLNITGWQKKDNAGAWQDLGAEEDFVRGTMYKPVFSTYAGFSHTYGIGDTTLIKVNGAEEAVAYAGWAGLTAVDVLTTSYVSAIAPVSEEEISQFAKITTTPEGALKEEEVPIVWFESDAEDMAEKTQVEAGSKFKAGKYYAYLVDDSKIEDYDAVLNDNFIWADDADYTLYYNYEGYDESEKAEIAAPWTGLSKAVLVKYTYRNLDSEDGEFAGFEFTEGQVSGVSAHIDGKSDDVVAVLVDEDEMELNTDYVVKLGSAIVEFTEEGNKKLNALEAGEHVITIAFRSGDIVELPLAINEPEENPNTIDSITSFVALAVIAMLGTVVVVKKARA